MTGEEGSPGKVGWGVFWTSSSAAKLGGNRGGVLLARGRSHWPLVFLRKCSATWIPRYPNRYAKFMPGSLPI